jgi:hypothetical protein
VTAVYLIERVLLAKFLEQWRPTQAAGLKPGARQFGNNAATIQRRPLPRDRHLRGITAIPIEPFLALGILLGVNAGSD